MGSARLAAARPAARPPARTVTTIPLQPEGLRGKNDSLHVQTTCTNRIDYFESALGISAGENCG